MYVIERDGATWFADEILDEWEVTRYFQTDRLPEPPDVPFEYFADWEREIILVRLLPEIAEEPDINNFLLGLMGIKTTEEKDDDG